MPVCWCEDVEECGVICDEREALQSGLEHRGEDGDLGTEGRGEGEGGRGEGEGERGERKYNHTVIKKGLHQDTIPTQYLQDHVIITTRSCDHQQWHHILVWVSKDVQMKAYPIQQLTTYITTY